MARTLVDTLRERTGDADARSFQLAGEDLARITGEDLVAAAHAYEERLAAVPEPLREAVLAELEAHAIQSGAWLREHNRNVNSRVRGYVRLGRLGHFEYPWPVVAVLGICTVIDGMQRMRMYGLVGGWARQLAVPQLERITDRVDDILRRTNRGIFADSVPTVLLVMRCHRLRLEDRTDLAEAILGGPLPPTMDEHTRARMRALYGALAIEDPDARFARLAELTLDHFGREQAIFTYHFGERLSGPAEPYASKLDEIVGNPSSVRAPRIIGRRGKRKVDFANYDLPRGFDFRDHGRRVEVFGDAFVRSVTSSLEDYRAGLDYVLGRFDRSRAFALRYPPGGTPEPDSRHA